uniref:L51_S25_CI-B8 domain-containing protein n=1 Tax=Macrostomum lignano TaxID=282301 RepID=A0A1I8JCJ2_9PLAT
MIATHQFKHNNFTFRGPCMFMSQQKLCCEGAAPAMPAFLFVKSPLFLTTDFKKTLMLKSAILNYAVTAVKAAAVKHQDTPIVVSYDIACKLQSHFRDNPRLRFAVPAFHAYGHNWQCQLQNNIRFLSDVGLTDASWFVERKRLLEKTQKKCDNDAEKIAEELALPHGQAAEIRAKKT